MFLRNLFSVFCVTILFISATAQKPMNKYDAAWKKINDLLEKQGLTKTAQAEVDKLYTLAKQEKNEAQVIKAILYKSALLQMKEEDEHAKTIALLEKEIATANEPAKSILKSTLADVYWEYFQMNRYRLYDRTTTENFKKSDIETWGVEDFHKQINSLYLSSLANARLLQQTRLETFDPVIIKGNVRKLRPTLFDLVAHRWLEYFMSEESLITRPAYAFRLDHPAIFSPAAEFIKHRFVTKDSTSHHHAALELLQRLIAFHINDKNPEALIDVDIARLRFARQHAVLDNRSELYEQALNHIIKQYGNNAAADQARFLYAELQITEKDTRKTNIEEAKKILEALASKKDSTEAVSNARIQLRELLRPALLLQAEQVNLPNQPFRVLVKYTNLAQAHFRLVKLDAKMKEALENKPEWQESYWTEILKLPAIKTYTQPLPVVKDYSSHSVEIKIDALPVGEYLLVGSSESDFTKSSSKLVTQFFDVSAISYINHQNEFFVLHRETGRPLVRASVQVWYRAYDYPSQKYIKRKGENIVTDANGRFKIERSSTSGNASYSLEISTTTDRLMIDGQHYLQPPPPATNMDVTTAFLFTDRSIYRPGQIVFFKGIVVRKDNKTGNSQIVPNAKTTVQLFDVNGQKIDSLQVTTNEFGAYSGRFTLPQNSLNGSFRIADLTFNSGESFSVEEYKRPKFSVEIRKPEGAYRANDTIRVTGVAKAYAGNTIDNAQVRYRVTRTTRWQIWEGGYLPRKIWPPVRREEMEITNGEVKTNALGEFEISFKAIPDASIDKKLQPTFYYEVDVDVTDINGETRSGNVSVAASWQALQLSINTPEKLPADSLKTLLVKSANINDVYQSARVTVTMHKLKAPQRIFRARYWEEPDQFLFTQEEYHQLFPLDIYKDENQPARWPKETKVAERTDTTKSNQEFAVNAGKLSPGWYLVEAITIDKYGDTVRAIKTIELTGKENTSSLAYADIITPAGSYEPGEKINYELKTNLDSAFVIHHVSRIHGEAAESLVAINNGSRAFEIPVTEADRGGIALNMIFIRHNRVYATNERISVPFTNKQLTVTYATYRDKTLPGSEEKWKVKIAGHKADAVAAEMLSAMYDASLDQFQPHQWSVPSLWDASAWPKLFTGDQGFGSRQSSSRNTPEEGLSIFEKIYDQLLSITLVRYARPVVENRAGLKEENLAPQQMAIPQRETNAAAAAPGASKNVAQRSFKSERLDAEMVSPDSTAMAAPPAASPMQVATRKNFNETAFFFPDLKTDSAGNIEFTFTMPEALTQWKWMLLAHTKDLQFAYSTKEIITQKDLMVQPNAPRFMREGDRMDFSTKIVNMTDKELTGQVELQLIDPVTNQPVDGWFRNFFPNQFFTVAAKQSVPAQFTIEIPFQYNKPVIYRVIARAGNVSDGEEMMLPVVSNRLLITESLPLNMRQVGSKQFTFTKLLQSGNSETLNHQSLTVEFTSNPAWYAVQSLPYLMEYPYECSEQNFNRFYANALATMIVQSSPRIKEVFERWRISDTAALMSNLEKNQELKSVLLQETPWVFQANSEKAQKKNLALLFDMVRMSRELQSTLGKLIEMQSPNGGFVWFQGGPDDRYITQYIMTGIGHLKKLNALPADERLTKLIRSALNYLDAKIKADYDQLVKSKVNLTTSMPDGYAVQYLYMRSFFTDVTVPGASFKAYNHFRKQAQQTWVKQGKYMQGMIALSLFRTGDVQTAKNIVKSLGQNALRSEEMGMYWKEFNSGGYYWYQAPIESHALLTEAFAEIVKDDKTTDELKTWLLKQKQTQHWRSTKATADACYALLMQGTNWLSAEPTVNVNLGGTTVSSSTGAEAGTGYFKKVIDGPKVTPAMGNITVAVTNSSNTGTASSSWGAVYWQYFEEMDKITPATTPLKLVKKLFVEKNSDRGPVLQPLNDGDVLKVGDKIKVRIELRVDRTLEYVHMKDMRAASLEPVNVLSQYKWQGGLGYYESTKDASTNFFFGTLAKGTWVFEYPLFVTHTGTFSNGVTTIQCMYAPEFTSHSEGIRINVEANQ
jgi:hypothetical protein